MSDAPAPSDDAPPEGANLPPRYAFAIGDRVTGPGVNGEVVDRPGPWSVTVIQMPGRFLLTASTVGLSKAS